MAYTNHVRNAAQPPQATVRNYFRYPPAAKKASLSYIYPVYILLIFNNRE